MNECIAKIYTKIIGNIFSSRLDVHLQVIQPILKFPYLNFLKIGNVVLYQERAILIVNITKFTL